MTCQNAKICWSLRLAGESSNSSASILVSGCKAGVFSSANDVFYNVLPPSWTLTESWGESKKDSKREQAILVCRVGSPLEEMVSVALRLYWTATDCSVMILKAYWFL